MLILPISCKKKHFVHQPINFSFADSIAGTYVGTRYTFVGPWTFTPPVVDTISVEVLDKRTDKICTFYIDCFDEEIILREDKKFTTKWRYMEASGGDPFTQEDVTKSEFSGDTLLYTENYRDKINDFVRYKLILVKQ